MLREGGRLRRWRAWPRSINAVTVVRLAYSLLS